MFDAIVQVCGHGETKDETARCLCNLAHSRYRFSVNFSYPDALIGRSRSIACTRFLQGSAAPFLIFVDSDQTFTNDNVESLLIALQAGYEVVAGGYAMADGKHFAIHGWEPNMVMDGTVKEVKYASTGFMGISRKVLIDIVEKLKLPLLHKGQWCELWAFFESGALPGEQIYISEDWFFCNLVRQAGYKVYFHTGVLVGHLKTVNLPPQGAIQIEEKPSTPLTVECLVKSTLANDLMEFLKMDKQDFVIKFRETPEEIVDEKRRTWHGSTEEFYRQIPEDYLFELTKFNMLDVYWQTKLAALGEIWDKRIVDVGCGIGTVSLFLAMNRNKVVGYDISPLLLEFANYRKERFGFANATFTDKFPNEALAEADLVVAIDTLEHIEDLQGFLKAIGDNMKTEAKLYHVDSFLDKRVLHYDHSDNLHKWLNEAGLLKIDPVWAVKR